MEPPFVRPKVEERPQLGVLANAATLFRDGIRDGESLFIRRPDCGCRWLRMCMYGFNQARAARNINIYAYLNFSLTFGLAGMRIAARVTAHAR